MSWWWCLDHSQTEEGMGCGSTSRLGPYDTAERAAKALKRIAHREVEQQELDREMPRKAKK